MRFLKKGNSKSPTMTAIRRVVTSNKPTRHQKFVVIKLGVYLGASLVLLSVITMAAVNQASSGPGNPVAFTPGDAVALILGLAGVAVIGMSLYHYLMSADGLPSGGKSRARVVTKSRSPYRRKGKKKLSKKARKKQQNAHQ